MAQPVELETFDLPDPMRRPADVGDAELAEQKLAAYEQGYGAGWNDALQAQAEDIARLRTDLGRRLCEMELSYRDARRHILTALEPLLRDMVSKVLPAVAQATLGPMVLEQLQPIAAELAATPVEICTSPAKRDLVEALVNRDGGLPLRIVAEATLTDGQAYLKLPGHAAKIDLDGVIETITGAVDAFFHSELHGDA